MQLKEIISEQEIKFVNFKISNNYGNFEDYLVPVNKFFGLIKEKNNRCQLTNELFGNIEFSLDDYFIDPFSSYQSIIFIAENLDNLDFRQIARKALHKDNNKSSAQIFFNIANSDIFFKNKHIEEDDIEFIKKYESTEIAGEMADQLMSVGIDIAGFYVDGTFKNRARFCYSIAHQDILKLADDIQKFKYIVANIARSYDKSPCFVSKYDESDAEIIFNLKNTKTIFNSELKFDHGKLHIKINKNPYLIAILIHVMNHQKNITSVTHHAHELYFQQNDMSFEELKNLL